ncbi:hypothetical protein NDU88_009711 [Pleurodeles waltl]|uniref:Uncharacterized protein n=1 Tax=Pleurodeles waltl TaxID=8319 RepID=A0AAV7QVE5_PLEWA|nr:hypothetical protein NDU88_009711 [Pleurodeles waltl]
MPSPPQGRARKRGSESRSQKLDAGGRGRATKEDGRLNPELRAVAVPRRRRGPRGGRKNHLNPWRNPSTTAEFPTRTPTTSRRDPAGWQRISEENSLQGGRSRIPSTRRPALLRTGEPSLGDPEEPPGVLDLRPLEETRHRAPGDLRCAALTEAQLRGRSRVLESREEAASLPLQRPERQVRPPHLNNRGR